MNDPWVYASACPIPDGGAQVVRPNAFVVAGGKCDAAASAVLVPKIGSKATYRSGRSATLVRRIEAVVGLACRTIRRSAPNSRDIAEKAIPQLLACVKWIAWAGQASDQAEPERVHWPDWAANPTCGSPRIVAELAKLGIEVAKSTVERYRPRERKPPSPTWRTFLDQHVRDLLSIDFFLVPTATFRLLFVFVVLAHDRRRIVHFNITERQTSQWTAQQLVEALPFDSAPRYLIRDSDGMYGRRVARRIASLGIDEVVTAPASPWQNAYVERVIGTLRRELLDHIVILNERHLTRLLSSWLDDYHPWRTHRSLDQDSPDGRPVRAVEPCNIVELPAVSGLHPIYLPKAA